MSNQHAPYARHLATLGREALVAELQALGLDRHGAEGVAPFALGRAVRLEGLDAALAVELQYRLRALGGEVVIGPSAYAGAGAPLAAVDAILLGSQAQLLSLAERLDVSAVEGPSMALAAAIRRALDMAEWQPRTLRLGQHVLDLSRRVAVMGILNATPDSFLEGGRFSDPGPAIEHGLRMVDEGADIIDVGGDSASGKARRIDAAEEIRRVEPVVRGLVRQVPVPVAVDTHRAATAAAALDAGATMVNDITGLGDPEMAATVVRGNAATCIMHIKGVPKAFPPDFDYRSLLGDVLRFLGERTQRAREAGIAADRICVDPGIEFGKLLRQDLELLRRLPELHLLGFPVLVAASRKDFIGNVLGLPPEQRLEGTAATVAFSAVRGAHIVRVHDVQVMVRVCRMIEALLGHAFADEAGRRRSDGTLA